MHTPACHPPSMPYPLRRHISLSSSLPSEPIAALSVSLPSHAPIHYYDSIAPQAAQDHIEPGSPYNFYGSRHPRPSRATPELEPCSASKTASAAVASPTITSTTILGSGGNPVHSYVPGTGDATQSVTLTMYMHEDEQPAQYGSAMEDYVTPYSCESFGPVQSPSDSVLETVWPRAVLLLVAVLWATNFPFVKALQSPPAAVPPAVAALIRFTLASLAFMPFAVHQLRTTASFSKLAKPTAIIGVFRFTAYFFQSISLQYVSAGKTAFLCSLCVILVPLLQRWIVTATRAEGGGGGSVGQSGADVFERVWLRMISVAPSTLALAGTALLEFGDAGVWPGIGDLWGVLQAFAFALTYLYTEQVSCEFVGAAFATTSLNLGVAAILSLFWAVGDASLTAGFLCGPDIVAAFSTTEKAVGLVYIGFVSTALAGWLLSVALERVSSVEMAVLITTEPLWAAAVAAVMLGERMSPAGSFGAALIVGACLVCQLRHVPIERARAALEQVLRHVKESCALRKGGPLGHVKESCALRKDGSTMLQAA